ncbi:MAG TPA: hypothetical protein VML95_07630, partial [Longimicrobiales bacterium]|nr:hypothetical protein [Longimicrobiales bacterium]
MTRPEAGTGRAARAAADGADAASAGGADRGTGGSSDPAAPTVESAPRTVAVGPDGAPPPAVLALADPGASRARET